MDRLIDHIIHSSVDGLLGWFHSVAIVNSAAVNTGMQVSLLYPDLHSFRYMSRNGIAGSYGCSIFSFWSNLHTDFHSGYPNLPSHWQGIMISFPPLLISMCCCFLGDSHSDQVKIETQCRFSVCFLFSLTVVGFELRTLHLIGRCSPFCSGYFGDRVSRFAQASLDHSPPI
jgi:hypothetical protein